MDKNTLLRNGDWVVRVLYIDGDRRLVIDCCKMTMPRWESAESLKYWDTCAEGDYHIHDAPTAEQLTTAERKVMRERYTLIAPMLPFVTRTRNGPQ